MPATFARTTDRPRLFDPSPRARRPARPAPDRAPATREPLPPAPDPLPLGPEPAPASREPLAPSPDPLTPAGRESLPPTVDPPAPGPDRAPAEPASTARGGGSLDDLLRGIWQDLTAHRTITCPVCHGQMAPRYGASAQPVGGRCRRCGSSLG
jgi:hypothetical protein